MAPIISKRNSEKRGETPYSRKSATTNTRERNDFGDFSLDFDIIDKLSELLNEGLMFAKNFELEENRLYADWVKRKAYLTDEEDTTIVNDNHAIRIDWCNCFINTTEYLLKNLANPQTRDMAMKMAPNILNQLYKYYECMKQNPPESYVESSVIMEEIDEEEEEESEEDMENWDFGDDDDEDDDEDVETPDVSKYTEEDRLLLEEFQRLVLGSTERYEFTGSKFEARHLRRLKEGRRKLQEHIEQGAELQDDDGKTNETDDDDDIEIIEKEYNVITIDDDDEEVEKENDDDDDEVTLLVGNIDGEEGLPVFGTTHPEVNITNARAFEHGKYHVDVTGLRLSTFVDVPRKEVTDKDIRSKYRWSNISKEADKDYFFDMVNGSNCTKQSQTMRREPFKQDDLLNPLTLASAMLRQCPCCGEQKAGFNILYPKVCQHYICRSCYVSLVDKYTEIGKHVACPCCGKCINQLFSIVREAKSETGRMVFYNAKLIATTS